MATVVFVHAHPDDEVLFTGGTMARAAAAGHRVVLVTATRGELGQDRAGVVALDETMAHRREQELRRAAAILGVARYIQLGFQDSGIEGGSEAGFVHVPVEEAAASLAASLVGEAPSVLVTYDERGVYGHPDHVQAYRVAMRAAELAGVASIFLATLDREVVEAMLQLAATVGLDVDDQTLEWAVNAGVESARITTQIDVGAYAEVKREAMSAHETQFPPGSPVLNLPPPVFQAVFGTEWFIEVGAPVGERRSSWLLAGGDR